MTSVQAGQVWRMKLGGRPQVIVEIDDGMAFVRDTRDSKKKLAMVAGAHVVSVAELERDWVLVKEKA